MKKKIKTLIIGIGNEFRCDDAIGIITVRKIKEKNIGYIDVMENNGDGASLIDAWQNYDDVYLIDAVRFNSNPGKIHIINAKKNPVPKEISLDSSHLFNIPEAIETARVMNKLPGKITICGIEGVNFSAGTQVSDKLLKASDEIVDIIMKRVEI